MKIFMLLSTIISLMTTHVQGTMISLDGTTLNITKQGNVLMIEGSGRHEFTLDLGDDIFDYSLNKVSTDTGRFLIEGYILNWKERSYDPFLLDLSKEGHTVSFHIFEDDLDQDIVGAYPLKDGYLVHLESTQDNGQGSLIPYRHHLGILNEGNYETIKTNDRVTDIKEDYLGYFVYFNYEEIPRYMFSFDGSLINEDDILGIDVHGVYEGEVNLQFLGSATLNDVDIKSPFKVSIPGKYTFIKSGKVIPFTLNPIVSGVVSNTMYSEAISIDYSSGQAYLNDHYYAPGELIEEPGHYIFGLYNDNYIYEIPFTITASIGGVIPMHTYTEPVTLDFEGDAYLNNQYIASGTMVSEPGHYTLKVFGLNDYLETISFKIEDEAENEDKVWVERGLLGGSLVLGVGVIIKTILNKRKK